MSGPVNQSVGSMQTPGNQIENSVLRHIGILVMIYAGLVVQTSLGPEHPGLPGRLFLPAAILLVIVASCESTAAILWSAVLGLSLDGLSLDRLGIQMTLAMLLALGLQWMRPLWNSRSLLALVSMTLIVALEWRSLSPMINATLTGRAVDANLIFNGAVQDAVITAVIGGVIVLVARGVFVRGPALKRSAARSVPVNTWQSPARC